MSNFKILDLGFGIYFGFCSIWILNLSLFGSINPIFSIAIYNGRGCIHH
jgi:hypothetical protein